MSKTYSELVTLQTLDERFEYLQTNSQVGVGTFGSARYINQYFYQSNPKWKKARSKVILRDEGNELGLANHPIGGSVIVHHINPVTEEMIIEDSPELYALDNLISCSDGMHKAIHYGNIKTAPLMKVLDRVPGDTCPWGK